MFEVIELSGMKTVTSKKACNHVYLVDVSYSMSSSLHEMRKHLKNIVSLVGKKGDTFSLLYFAGQGQCGVVFEAVEANSTTELSAINNSIDKFIVPIGMTAFKEPIQLCIDTAKGINNGLANSFIMLTDGYDNSRDSKKDILDVCDSLPEAFDSSAFIEYGWYCDRDLISEMARHSGGAHLFSEGYKEYEAVFEKAVQSEPVELVEVKVNKAAKNIMYVHDDNIMIVEPHNATVKVPGDVTKVYSVMPNDVLSKHLSEDHLYLVLYYALKTNNSKLAWNCLEKIGDVAIIDGYTNAFTRKELSHVEEAVRECVLDSSKRYINGKDLNHVPDKNSITVLDVLSLLSANESKLVVDSPLFNYKTIGRSSVAKEKTLKFIPDTGFTPDITSLVYNSNRPNVSIRINRPGTVMLPENDFGLKFVPSAQYRTYTIIKDGILNIEELPVLVNDTVIAELNRAKVKYSFVNEKDNYVLIDLTSIPVINRAMTSYVSIDYFTDTLIMLTRMQAKQKVINSLLKEREVKSNIAGLVGAYGEEVATWLGSLGVRDGGFSPLSTQAESTDFYESVSVKYAIKGFSSLPSLNAVRKKLADNKKLTNSEALMHSFLADLEICDVKELEKIKTETVSVIRIIQSYISKNVYSLVLGKTWFTDVDEDPVVKNISLIDGVDTTVKIEKTREKVKI